MSEQQIQRDQYVRLKALEQAVEHHRDKPDNSGHVVETAARFAKFIRGQE